MQSIGFDLGVVAVNLTGCRRSFSVSVAPSLSIGTSAEFYNLINKFQCFGCEEHGNVLEFVTLMEELDQDPDDGSNFRKAATIISKVCHISLSDRVARH